MLVAKQEYVYEQKSTLPQEHKVILANPYALKRLRLICGILLCFLTGCMMMYRYTLINEMSVGVQKQKSQLESINKENGQLQVAVEKSVDLNLVEEYAAQKLGMQKPDKYQVVYVTVEKSDFTEVSNPQMAFVPHEVDANPFGAIISDIIKYLY